MSSRPKIGVLSSSSTKSVRWIIKDFFSYSEIDSSFISSDFPVSDYSWSLVIYPSGQSNSGLKEHVSVYLKKYSTTCHTDVDFVFGIKSVDDEITHMRPCTIRSDNLTGGGAPDFIKKSTLLRDKDLLVPSNTLTVTCLIKVQDGRPDTVTRLYNLAVNLKEMFISQKNTDISLKVREITFLAHKFILSARSPVLAAMFENDSTEKITGIVNIDCNPKSFLTFLLYLYSGEFNFSKCDVFDLYKIADKYVVPELKLICVDFMARRLSVNNVLETYAFGHEFKEDTLLTKARTFFEENFNQIVLLDIWTSFLEDDCNLAKELLKSMAP